MFFKSLLAQVETSWCIVTTSFIWMWRFISCSCRHEVVIYFLPSEIVKGENLSPFLLLLWYIYFHVDESHVEYDYKYSWQCKLQQSWVFWPWQVGQGNQWRCSCIHLGAIWVWSKDVLWWGVALEWLCNTQHHACMKNSVCCSYMWSSYCWASSAGECSFNFDVIIVGVKCSNLNHKLKSGVWVLLYIITMTFLTIHCKMVVWSSLKVVLFFH